VISSSKNAEAKRLIKISTDFKLNFQIYPEIQILGVSLAAAIPAARVATFTSIFFADKKGYPLPSLTQKTVLSAFV